MTVPKVRDERLCWLAVRDDIERLSRRTPGYVLAMATIGLIGALGNGGKREQLSRTMERYAVAVEETAGRLSAEERVTLRATGQVPEWFLAEVKRRYRRPAR